MPLYDFKCGACEARFDANVPHGTVPPCPECGDPNSERQMTAFSGPFTVGMRGYTARRSNLTRKEREEQRAERKAQRLEQRDAG